MIVLVNCLAFLSVVVSSQAYLEDAWRRRHPTTSPRSHAPVTQPQSSWTNEKKQLSQVMSLDNIPQSFEIRDVPRSNPVTEFEIYAEQIHRLANKQNLSVIYKIQIEAIKRTKDRGYGKKFGKKTKPKKFNIPLKKNSMKLSNFEVFLRKAAEVNKQTPGNKVNNFLTSTDKTTHTTKMLHSKYKPVVSKLNNFSKIIRPVKNRIITLS